MRRPVLVLSVPVGLLVTAGAVLAVPPVIPSSPATAPFVSDNVTHVGTVPVDGVGVSMEVRQVGEQVRAFVSGAGGLSIYDATDPKAPELLGHLPLYNWENEDVAVSQDGTKAFLTEFTAGLYLHAVDVSDPTLPLVTDTIRGGPHTVVCADDPCDYLYGSDGQTFDVRDLAAISELPQAQSWGAQVGVSAGHNLHEDDAGIWVSDSSPLTVFRQVDGDPLRVEKLTTGRISKDSGYQHNNVRPNADEYVPRAPEEGLDGPLRPGELLLTNGETNFTGTCDGSAGAFSTWSMAGFDQGAPMQQLEVLRPVSGTWTEGDPAVNKLGCSGHWFTAKDAADGQVLVAAAWYEHGTRFLAVDPATGKISQVGFFQPVRGATSEAFWMPGSNVVWAIDYQSGIDILEFDEQSPVPTTEEVDASWLAKAGVVDPFAEAARQLGRADTDAGDHAVMRETTREAAGQSTAFQRATRIG